MDWASVDWQAIGNWIVSLIGAAALVGGILQQRAAARLKRQTEADAGRVEAARVEIEREKSAAVSYGELCDDLMARLKMVNELQANNESRIAALVEHQAENERRIAALERELEQTRRQRDEASAKSDKLEAKIAELEARIAELEHENACLREQQERMGT